MVDYAFVTRETKETINPFPLPVFIHGLCMFIMKKTNNK